MVDRAVLAEKIASVRDAVARIREVLPPSSDALLADRTRREIVILNLFVALQDCLAMAAHWLANAGLDVPQSYAEVLLVNASWECPAGCQPMSSLRRRAIARPVKANNISVPVVGSGTKPYCR